MGASDEQRVCGVAKRRGNRNVDGAGYLRCDEPGRVLRRSNGGFSSARARSAAAIRNCMPNSPGSFARIPVATRPRLQQHLKASSTGAAHRWFINIPTVRRAYELVGDLKAK